MKQNKQKDPMKETTKDDSSDIEKVREQQKKTPPEPDSDRNKKSGEDEQAQKGHA